MADDIETPAPASAWAVLIRNLGNGGPFDPDLFAQALKTDNADLLKRPSQMEFAASKLPREILTDDDVEKINAFVVRARALARDIENARTEAKAPFLNAGKAVDSLFGDRRQAVLDRASEIEKRPGPYLKAKAAAAAAEAAAAAAKARQEREAREAEERAAREQAAAAQAAADEADRLARQAVTDAEQAAAREVARLANEAAAEAEKSAVAAAKDVASANRAVDRTEKTVAGGGRKLARTSAGGGAARLVTVWHWRIADQAALTASLGPVAEYLTEAAVVDALGRAAKADPRPAIPGVEFYATDESKTAATRT